MADINSPYWPYDRIMDYASLPDAELLLKKVTDYILDLPAKGYVPHDNNDFPRCRIAKMLYWDTEDPLGMPLPTAEQKRSILFDPKHPDTPPDKKRLYRIYPMIYTAPQAEYVGSTTLKIIMGAAKANGPYRIDQSVTFEVLSNTAYDGNVQRNVLSRTYDIAASLLKALNGVNIEGVGTFYFDRRQNSDCELLPIWDKSSNVGYDLTMGVSFIGGEGTEY